MKKTLLLSALTCGLLLSTTNIQAKSDTKTLVQHQISENKKVFKQAPKEILDALQETSLAMQNLQHHKIDEAKKYLKQATDNFNKALKDNPSLDILPLDESIEVYENLASAQEINHTLTQAQEYLIHYKLDAARAALAPLKDEMDIKTISIPMKLFPIATQNALDALNKGKTKEAMQIMAEGYNTFVIEEAVIPLPLLAAQEFIVEASSLDKSKKEEATKLLDAAKKELEKAKVLGYTNNKTPEYKALSDAIDAVKKEIKGKNIVEKLYDDLKNTFASLVHKSKTAKHNKAEAKVNAYEKKEASKAVKDTKNFETEAKKDVLSSLEGARLYRQNCAICHGIDGKTVPTGATSPLAGRNATKLALTIRAYRDQDDSIGTYTMHKSSEMMKEETIRLSDRQIGAIAEYISTLK
jgi:cytochrome c553